MHGIFLSIACLAARLAFCYESSAWRVLVWLGRCIVYLPKIPVLDPGMDMPEAWVLREWGCALWAVLICIRSAASSEDRPAGWARSSI